MIRILAGVMVQTVLLGALILGPAWGMTGSLDWPRGWLATGVLFATSLAGGLWFGRTDPGLAHERASLPRPQTRRDALASGAIAAAAVAWFIVAAWDAHKLRLLETPPAVSLWAGLAVFAAGVGVIVWTFQVNSFAATVVKVQDEREQRVIETGPYAVVRHPMYLGAIGFFAGLGLVLDSAAAALLAAPLFAAAFVPRMLVEETVLRRDLAGYAGYQSRVRARIVPGVF